MIVYRCFRLVNTSHWLDVLFTVADGEFSVPEISQRTDMANALGLGTDELEFVEASSDQRNGALLAVPTPPKAPLDPDQVRIDELLAIPRSNWTAAQRAELLEHIAREIRR